MAVTGSGPVATAEAEALSALAAARRAHEGPALSKVLARRGLGSYRGYAEMLEAIETFLKDGLTAAMNRYNR